MSPWDKWLCSPEPSHECRGMSPRARSGAALLPAAWAPPPVFASLQPLFLQLLSLLLTICSPHWVQTCPPLALLLVTFSSFKSHSLYKRSKLVSAQQTLRPSSSAHSTSYVTATGVTSSVRQSSQTSERDIKSGNKEPHKVRHKCQVKNNTKKAKNPAITYPLTKHERNTSTCVWERERHTHRKKDKFLYIVKTFCSLSQLSKQCDSRREFLFKAFNLSFVSFTHLRHNVESHPNSQTV